MVLLYQKDKKSFGEILYNEPMKKLTPKTSGFTGKSVFLKRDLSHKISEEKVLPEDFVLGFELPEDGQYFARTSLGTIYISYESPGKWTTSSGSYGDLTYRSLVAPREYGEKIDWSVVADIQTDPDALLEDFYGAGDFENPYNDGYTQAEFEYTHTEFGDLFINKNGCMAINKKTGKIQWLATLQHDDNGVIENYIPLYPWSNYATLVCINEKYIFMSGDSYWGNTLVLETATGRVIYQGDVLTDFGINIEPWGCYTLPTKENNQFIIVPDTSLGDAFIATIENDILSFAPHPASELVDPTTQNFYLEMTGTPYIQHVYLLNEDGSYYFNRLHGGASATITRNNTVTRFSADHQVQWSINTGALINEDLVMVPDTINGGIVMLPMDDGHTTSLHLSDLGVATVLTDTGIQASPFTEVYYSGYPDETGRIYAAFYNYVGGDAANAGVNFYYYDLNTHKFINMNTSILEIGGMTGEASNPKMVSDSNGTSYFYANGFNVSAPNSNPGTYFVTLSQGIAEIRQLEYSWGVVDESNWHIDKDGDIYAIYSGRDSALVKLTDVESEFMFKLPSNPGVPLTAGNWYWKPEDDWFPGRLYYPYDTIPYGTSGYAMGDYIVLPGFNIKISTGEIIFKGIASNYEINKYDDDNIIFGSNLLNVNTGATTTLTLPTAPGSAFNLLHQFKPPGRELVRVYANVVYILNGAAWDTVTTFPVSNNRLTYYVDHGDKLYQMVFSGLIGAVTCTVTEYDFSTSTQSAYDTQIVPQLPSPSYDALLNHSSYSLSDFQFDTLAHSVYNGTAYFGNSYYYDAPNKTFGIIPFNFEDDYYSRPYSNSSGILQNPLFRLGDLLFMTTPSGALAAYALNNTVSPY